METTITVERMDAENELLHPHEILRENLTKKRKKSTKTFTEPRCGICGKILCDKASLAHHIQTHSIVNLYQCRECPYKGKTRKYLMRHISIRHREPTTKVQCKYCGKEFRFRSKMLDHERVHTGEKPNKCDVCGKAFSSTYSLGTHKFIHTDEKPFACSFCEYACRDSSSLRKHEERHMGTIKRHKCDHCGKCYDTKYRLREHVTETHTAPDARDHACDKCESTFKSKKTLQRHKALVHDRVKACKCGVCGAYIPNGYNLSAHMRSHIDVRPYACAHAGCELSFKDKSTLKKHSVTHNPSEHLKCAHCGRTFARKNRLMLHIRALHSSSDTKSYRCRYCGVCFLTKNYLSKHMKTEHSRRRTFACDLCEFVTHQKPSIVAHIARAHDAGREIVCTACGMTFKRTAQLKLHYKNSHNIQFKTSQPRSIPDVQIKQEPLDLVPDLEIDLLDIEKEEPFAGFETEYTEDLTKIYQPTDNKESGLEMLFKKMIHDPEFNFNETHETDKVSAKLENRTEDPPSSPMPLEELLQQDSFLLVVGGKQATPGADESSGKTEAETRTVDPQTTPLPEDEIETHQKVNEESMFEGHESIPNKTESEIQEADTALQEDAEETIKEVGVELISEKRGSSDTIQTEIQSETSNLTEDTTISKDPVNNLATAENGIEENAEDKPTSVKKYVKQDSNGTKQNIEATFTIDKQSEELMKQRVRELIRNQRALDSVRREEFGRRVLKKVSEEEAKILKPNARPKPVYKPKVTESKTIERKVTNKMRKVKRKRRRKNKDKKKESDGKEEKTKGDGIGKLKFNSFQCYVCYKLFETKKQLLVHCQVHFDVCSENTLIKCPLCDFVTQKDIKKHFKIAHKEDINISFMRILDRKENDGQSRYYYHTKNEKAKEIEIIPSVKILNKKASMDLDRRNREKNNRIMSKSKLVKKGNEWMVLKEKFDVSGYVLPSDKELDKKDADYLKKLKKLGKEAKTNGIKMLYPCNKCEKVCQNLSAVTLHSRKHDPDKKPFAPKIWKHKVNSGGQNTDNSKTISKKSNIDVNNRTAKPKPIVNKHKCDPKLKEFYENNIRGLNIEFWQFLKIYNKMDRENVNDFDDLIKSTEYGVGHVNYLEETQSDNTNNVNNEINKETEGSNKTVNKTKPNSSVTSKQNKVASLKNKFTRTIRISREEYIKRKKLQKELRAKIALEKI